jgi:hypothetical protein
VEHRRKQSAAPRGWRSHVVTILRLKCCRGSLRRHQSTGKVLWHHFQSSLSQMLTERTDSYCLTTALVAPGQTANKDSHII